jgi:[ribosomal protein S5]-alanine N-acetyltransferase
VTSDTVLETERLILRHLRLEDLDDLAALYANPEFMRFFGGPSTSTREELRSRIETRIEEYATIGYGFYATIHKPDRRFIGRCGLLTQWIAGAKEMEVWGRGLATEAALAIKEYAFRRFDAPRLISIVDRENIASRRVAEKNGMRLEKEFEFEGYPCCLYVVDRAEWDGSESMITLGRPEMQPGGDGE